MHYCWRLGESEGKVSLKIVVIALLAISMIGRGISFRTRSLWFTGMSSHRSRTTIGTSEEGSYDTIRRVEDETDWGYHNRPVDGKTVVEKGHVYFVATPIGNLGDISLRAMKILEDADILVAEDTRRTRQLLRLLSLPVGNRTVISHHEHNQRQSIEHILRLSREGRSIAVVSDAGTPGISDPGSPLAAALARSGVPLHPVPGPSAVICALSVSGFPCQPFSFFGFIPVKGAERKDILQQIQSLSSHTIVLYEAPHRVGKTLRSLATLSPLVAQRPVVCGREITKKYEEFARGSLEQVSNMLENRTGAVRKVEVKGEFTIVIGPALEERPAVDWSVVKDKIRSSSADQRGREAGAAEEELIIAKINELLQEARGEGATRKDAVNRVSTMLPDVPRKVVYSLALKLDWS